jgi:hypothetical protein
MMLQPLLMSPLKPRLNKGPTASNLHMPRTFNVSTHYQFLHLSPKLRHRPPSLIPLYQLVRWPMVRWGLPNMSKALLVVLSFHTA